MSVLEGEVLPCSRDTKTCADTGQEQLQGEDSTEKCNFSNVVYPEECDDENNADYPVSTSSLLLTTLLDFSNDEAAETGDKVNQIFADDWEEAVTGWKAVVPNAKYMLKRKRRKCVDPEVPNRPSTFLKCAKGEEWKSNVEPVTYRYIPNNGQYRLHKFCEQERDWYTVRRKNPERVSPSLKTKYMQREIKRQLRKDFKKKFSNDGQSDKAKRSHSSISGTNVNPSPAESLIKSASDLIAENLTSRIDVLDKEIKKESQRKRTNDDQSNMSFPLHLAKVKQYHRGTAEHVYRLPHHSEQPVHSAFIVTPFGRQQQQLRPLEKLTPQHRLKEHLIQVPVKVPETGGGDSTCSETDIVKNALDITNLDLEKLRIMPLSETSTPYVGSMLKSKESSKNGLNSKVSLSHVTGNKRLAGQFVSSIAVNNQELGTETKQDASVASNTRSRHIQNQNLPEIAGRRLEVAVNNYKLR